MVAAAPVRLSHRCCEHACACMCVCVCLCLCLCLCVCMPACNHLDLSGACLYTLSDGTRPKAQERAAGAAGARAVQWCVAVPPSCASPYVHTCTRRRTTPLEWWVAHPIDVPVLLCQSSCAAARCVVRVSESVCPCVAACTAVCVLVCAPLVWGAVAAAAAAAAA